MRTIITMLAAITPATVHAAGTTADTTSPMVWIFCGLCALVVIAQMVPVVLLLTSMIRGMVTKTEKKTVSES